MKKRVRSAGGGASMTVRNLRIREDTAKYLRNLDLSSAYYDPKTRSMRENPTPQDDPSSQFALQFQGDNVTRKTGETLGFERLNRHAFDAYQKGQEIHMQAAPSQAELLYKQFKEKKEKLRRVTKSAILEKYGNAAATEESARGSVVGSDGGLRGVRQSRSGDQGARARGGQVSLRGGRARAEPHEGVGVVLAGWPVGLRVLQILPEEQLLHR